MQVEIRKLNPAGLAAFSSYIALLRNTPEAVPPRHLLHHDEFSEPLDETIHVVPLIFENQFAFGCHLVDLLSPLSATSISRDNLLWSWLALFFFDTICPAESGQRIVLENSVYLIPQEANYQRIYRHLVRTPWAAVRLHGACAKVLLITRSTIAKRSDIFEQLASRQDLFGNPTVIAAANSLYFDLSENMPKRGAGGKLGGSARRLASVVQQLDLTFDLQDCSPTQLMTLLPREFDRWKSLRQ